MEQDSFVFPKKEEEEEEEGVLRAQEGPQTQEALPELNFGKEGECSLSQAHESLPSKHAH